MNNLLQSIKSKHLFILASLLFTLLMVYKLISLPFDLVEEATEVLPKKVAEHKVALEKAKTVFETNRHNETFKAYYRFEAADDWQGNFNVSSKKLQEVSSYVENNIKKVVTANKASQTKFLKSQLTYAHNTLKEAQALYNRPTQRVQTLMALEKNAPSTIEEGIKSLKAYDKRYKALVAMYLKRSKEFSHQKEQLTPFIQEILKRYKKLQKNLNQASQELEKKAPNLLRVEKKLAKYKKGYALLLTKHKEFEALLKGMAQSYTKVLIDMKVERLISLERVSWNERSDAAEVTRNFNNVRVSKTAYLRALQNQNVALARIAFFKFYSGVFKKLPSSMMHLPSSHTHAEFYLTQASEKFYHKYAIIENDTITYTHFEEVSWEYFEAHIPHMGMEIVNKPYGEFETRYIENYAAPSGMNFCDNSAYGSWSGVYGDVWKFNAAFHKMNQLVVMPIHLSEYKLWKQRYKHKKTYYGKNIELGTFGSKTFSTNLYGNSELYRNSYFYTHYYSKKTHKFSDIFASYASDFSRKQVKYQNDSQHSSSAGSSFFYYSSGNSGYASHYYDNNRYATTRSSRNFGYVRSQPSVRNSGSRARGRGPGGGGK